MAARRKLAERRVEHALENAAAAYAATVIGGRLLQLFLTIGM